MLLAVFAPLFGDPYATPIDGLTPNGLPLGVLSSGHILGTDSLGRDMLARVAYRGAREPSRSPSSRTSRRSASA